MRGPETVVDFHMNFPVQFTSTFDQEFTCSSFISHPTCSLRLTMLQHGLSVEFPGRLDEFTPQNISNLVYGAPLADQVAPGSTGCGSWDGGDLL